jgi:serine/threonine protein kinase
LDRELAFKLASDDEEPTDKGKENLLIEVREKQTRTTKEAIGRLDNSEVDALFQEAEKIGNGKLSEVYSAPTAGLFEISVARSADSRPRFLEEVALKLFSFGLDDPSIQHAFQHDLQVLRTCKHANLVRYRGYGIHNQKLFVAMDYAEGGNLEDGLFGEDCKQMTKEEALAALIQITTGLEHLHHKGICHSNLHLRNILRDGQIYKIGDYGFSKTIQATVFHGFQYVAPEVWNSLDNPKRDIYSLGIIMWEITEHKRWPHNQHIHTGGKEARPPISEANKFGDLIRNCWHEDPTKRPNAFKVLESLQAMQNLANQETLSIIQWNEIQMLQTVSNKRDRTVQKAYWNGQLVAVKEVHSLDQFHQLRGFLREAKNLVRISARGYKHVVRLVGLVDEPNYKAIVTELCSEGSLPHFMKNNDLDLDDKLTIAIQVVDALHCVHTDLQLIHRDLAARNVLIHRSGDEYIAKLADFELSSLGVSVEVSTERRTPMPIAWLAPEIKKKAEFSLKTDIYSFGVLLWELFTEREPPIDKKGNPLKLVFPADWLPSLKLLVKKCRSEDPNERPPNWKAIYDELVAIKTRAADKMNRITLTTPPSSENVYDEYVGLLQWVTEPKDSHAQAFHRRWSPIVARVSEAVAQQKQEILLGPERLSFSVEGDSSFQLEVAPRTTNPLSQSAPVVGVRVEVAEGGVDKAIKLACLVALKQNLDRSAGRSICSSSGS